MFLAKRNKIPVTSWGATGSFQGFQQHPRAPMRNLPKIEIKEFSGDPKEFQSFIDCFESSLSIYEITDVQKFTYLKKYLTDDAELKKRLALVKESLYIDDLGSGAPDVKSGILLYETAKKLFQDGGMNLRKWKSNSKEMMNYFEKFDEKSETGTEEPEFLTESHEETNHTEKILGIPWNINNDEFVIDINEQIKTLNLEKITKRKLLRFTASIFDPLGIIAPAVFILKQIFQLLCKRKTNWDERLDSNELKEFEKWVR